MGQFEFMVGNRGILLLDLIKIAFKLHFSQFKNYYYYSTFQE